MQTLGQQRFAIQNPLLKNYRHTQVLAATLQLPPDQVYSVIAFVGRCHPPEGSPANVTQGSGCVRLKPQLQAIGLDHGQGTGAGAATADTVPGSPLATHRAHAQQIKERRSGAGQRACCACGSPRVLRTARVGAHAGQAFWGCSAFPQCREVQAA